jgi:hypothetical protein
VLQDNVQMGHLLQGFREYVELRVAQFPGARMCLVKTDKTDAAFVCDMGVYGKNRNFRMAYCTKSGKNSPLVPVSAASAAFDLAVFQATLLCHFRGDCKVLTVENAAPARPREEARRFVSGSCVGSPFPKVDAFVRSLIEREGGFVRSALFFPASSRLTYSIGGRFRYCANVARNHKSNGVYFVVEISTQKVCVVRFDLLCLILLAVVSKVLRSRLSRVLLGGHDGSGRLFCHARVERRRLAGSGAPTRRAVR